MEDSSGTKLSIQLKLSRKEYYSRMSRLMKAGMVKRKNGKHFLTAFGKVVHDSQVTLRKAVENHGTLMAIDCLYLSNDIAVEERNNVIERILEDRKIKEMVLRHVA